MAPAPSQSARAVNADPVILTTAELVRLVLGLLLGAALAWAALSWQVSRAGRSCGRWRACWTARPAR